MSNRLRKVINTMRWNLILYELFSSYHLAFFCLGGDDGMISYFGRDSMSLCQTMYLPLHCLFVFYLYLTWDDNYPFLEFWSCCFSYVIKIIGNLSTLESTKITQSFSSPFLQMQNIKIFTASIWQLSILQRHDYENPNAIMSVISF